MKAEAVQGKVKIRGKREDRFRKLPTVCNGRSPNPSIGRKKLITQAKVKRGGSAKE